MGRKSKKIINAWAVYDWANSVYPLVITSTIFPIYYENITREGGEQVQFMGATLKNTSLYTFALAFAYLVTAAISPLLSGIADYSGKKKRFMQFFCLIGSLSCAGLYFFDSIERLELGIWLVILAGIGYAGSVVFYNAFLPEIAHPVLQDRVSAKGYSLGYVGSSVLLIANLAVIMNAEALGVSAGDASRWSFLSTGLWWLLFAQYSFFHLPDSPPADRHRLSVSRGYNELKQVWEDLRENEVLKKFLSAFFIYNMGVQTVMLIATLFGSKELRLEPSQLIITILIIQFVAIAGATLFSYLSKKKGNFYTLRMCTVFWCVICILAYFISPSSPSRAIQFFTLAVFVGLIMGGIQSLSRSTYSKLLPKTRDHSSYFSFYDICDKTGVVLGMAIFGIIEQNFSSMKQPIIALLVFFIAGYFLLLRIKKSKELTPALQ